MTLPPWKPAGQADQIAFAAFVIAELDRMDAAAANEASDNADSIDYLRRLDQVRRQAASIGLTVPLPAARVRPGPKPAEPSDPDFTDFQRAALDVPRIRAVFRRHWGKRNRYDRPLAEEIAAQRWELSPVERAALIDKFQRKS